MIISSNQEPEKEDFLLLLNATISELNAQAKINAKKIVSLEGRNLEPYVKDLMSELAINTPFENSIELIGGQKFPDIIAKKYYGIEVKTTKQNHWKTTGNSVLESTRVDGVERIFMLFAKLASPIEFRFRPYEEVLSEVVVTHSPRYLIDMNLERGKTIFDKIEMPYDVLRRQENPIKPIVAYYKSKLKEGESLWWMDENNGDTANNIVIQIWNNLSQQEKQDLKCQAMVFFPELFGAKNDKFNRFAIWLVNEKSIVCPNVRDLFTAGGKGNFQISNYYYENISRIYLNLFENLASIFNIIEQIPASILSEYWQKQVSESTKKNEWLNLICFYASKNKTKIDLKKILSICIECSPLLK